MHRTTKGTLRRALALAIAMSLLALAGGQTASAKTTAKKKTTKKAAATARKTTKKATTATTARAADQGPAKNITGTEVAPGNPIRIGLSMQTGGEQFSGNIAEMYEVAFDTLRKKGELPVHGRDVVLYARGYRFDAPDVQAALRASCTALAQDDKVFAGLVWAGPVECLSADNKIPAIGGPMSDEAMARSFPYGFSIQWSPNIGLENYARWADESGLLKGRKLAIYRGQAVARGAQVNEYFKQPLKKLGHTILEDLAGDDEAADRVAVQRFKAAGVDTVFMMSARPGDFARTARGQGFKPRFIFGGGDASDNAAISDGSPARLNMTKDMFDGSFAMARRRVAENGLAGNPPATAAGVECATNYEKASGERVRQIGTAAEQNRWSSVQWACDHARAVVAGLKAAGPKLTQGAFINGLETAIKGQQSGLHADISFSRTNHYGSNQLRTLQLDGDCLCWKIKTPMRPAYIG